MRSNIIGLIAIGISLVCAPGFAGDETQDVTKLDDLLVKVKKVLPQGWAASIELSDDMRPSRRGPFPTLIIKSIERLPVGHSYPSASPDSISEPPSISQEIVTRYFTVLPLVTPQNHTKIQQHNELLQRRRQQFVSDHLNKISWAHKGARPIPPDKFDPETENEIQLVKQYGLLWVSTQPQSLPTHHTDHFSFAFTADYLMYIHDPKKAKEYDEILEAVEQFIVPYENKR